MAAGLAQIEVKAKCDKARNYLLTRHDRFYSMTVTSVYFKIETIEERSDAQKWALPMRNAVGIHGSVCLNKRAGIAATESALYFKSFFGGKNMVEITQTDEDCVLFSVDDGIATITLNRPKQRNALSIAAMNGLYDAWEKVDQTPEIRVVILTSSDCGTFCAGMDLKETSRVKQETGKDILTFFKDPFHYRMRRVKVPIIAAMTGHLMAGGMLMSLNCDLRVGLNDTKIGITESKIGRGSPWGMPLLWMLPQPIVMEMVLTAELMPIERFRDLGFINYLESTPDAVRERALALAKTIRNNAPLSVRAGKRSLLTAMSVGCDNGLEMAWHTYRSAYESEDAQEGARAFAEKRAPVWKGA